MPSETQPPRSRLGRNAFFILLQAVVSGAILFLLYRFLLKRISAEDLGVWSLVSGLGIVARIGDAGFSGAVTKFVAQYFSRTDFDKIRATIQTAGVSTSIFTGASVIILYFAVRIGLPFFVSGPKVLIAIGLLPYVLVALWINSNAAIFFAALEGLQKFGAVSGLQIVGSIVLMVSALLLVPICGLVGVVLAQIIQVTVQLLTAWVFVRRQVNHMPVFPRCWKRDAFKEMVGYGSALQVNAMVTLMYDPLTKVLLARFGGLPSVVYFEMANRLVVQVRAALISGVRVLVPYVAALKETAPQNIQVTYKSSYKIILYVTLPIFALLFSILPAVSEVWIGRNVPEFVFFARCLIAGWGLNTLTIACYYSYLGSGRVKWTAISHVATGMLNCALGYVGGKFWGGGGVVAGWGISLVLGAAIVTIAYHHEHEIALQVLFPKDTVFLIGSCIFGAVIILLMYQPLRHQIAAPVVALMSAAAFLIIVVYPMWVHPARASLIRAIRSCVGRT